MKKQVCLVLVLVFSFSLVSAFSLEGLFDGISGNAIQSVTAIHLVDNGDKAHLDSFSIKSSGVKSKIIGKTFSSNKNYGLSLSKISGLTVSANVEFEDEQSLVRVILVDSEGKEYLVYESFPLLSGSNSFSVKDICEETCLLDSINSVSLRIEVENAKIKINNIKYSTKINNEKGSPVVKSERERISNLQEEYNIKKLNKQLELDGKNWVAGKTSISGLSYQEKKGLFKSADGKVPDKLPNLQGFEYYKSGVFDMVGSGEDLFSVDSMEKGMANIPISRWDWRNVSGENWISSVKNQGSAGTCMAFSNVGTLESQINLYYNQQVDVDLSEQMFVDCKSPGLIHELSNAATLCWDVDNCFPGYQYCMFIGGGIADESCDVYTEREFSYNPSYCDYNHVCSDWANRIWKVSDFHDYKLVIEGSYSTPSCTKQTVGLSEDDFKKILISKGPVDSGINSWAHSMVLVGFETEMETGETVWIFKNSWGSDWGEEGYLRIKVVFEDLGWGSLPIGPFIPPTNESYWPIGFDNQIKCVDKDVDGYCNWGISDSGLNDSWRQNNCPVSCWNNSQKDCDDSNFSIKQLREDYSCQFAWDDPVVPKKLFTCKKLTNYTTAWQKTKCKVADCGKDVYVGCNKKKTAIGVKKFQEVCRKKVGYKTECSEDPSCGVGGVKISQTAC